MPTSSEPSTGSRPTTGSVCWIELPAIDLERIQKFYSAVFGWSYTPGFSPQGNNYVLFNKGSTSGGFIQVEPDHLLTPASAPNDTGAQSIATRVTLLVDNVDESLKVVEENGGKVYIAKKEIPNYGYVAYFTDTEKNVVGIWSMTH